MDKLEKKLKSMRKSELVREIVKMNKPLKGYSTKNKDELIKLMLSNSQRFLYLTTSKENKKQLLAVKKARIELKKKSIQDDKEVDEADKKLAEMRAKLKKLKEMNKP